MPDYRGQSLVNKDLTGVSDLTGSDFRLVNLSGAKLDGKDLGGSKFDGCRAEGASFKGCTFGTATSLDGGDFQAADWTTAVFTNVSFTNWGSYRGPYMRFAKVDGATGIGSSVNLNGMLFWPLSVTSTHTSTDITPLMTSANTPSPYVVSGNATFGGYEAWRIFDSTTTTWWVAVPPLNTFGIYLGSAKTITRYNLSSSGAGGDPTRSLKSWNFQGSNNGSTWTTIHTPPDQAIWANPETRTFTFTNTTAYSYYQWVITANQGNVSYTEVGDIKIWGY